MPDETVLLGRDPQPDDKEPTQATIPAHLPRLQSPSSVMLVFVNNPNVLQFELNDTAIIGRRTERGEQPDIDLAPYGGFPGGVSRHHMRMSRLVRGVWIEDLNSSNGTYLNDEKLFAGKAVPVHSGQSLRLGQLQMWIYFQMIP